MIREVVASIIDAARFGDWRGHMASLCAVLAGVVTGDTLAGWPVGQEADRRDVPQVIGTDPHSEGGKFASQ